MENIFQFDQSGNNALQELGLTHKFPVHIDVANNESGFALYVETPDVYIDDYGWVPLFGIGDDGGAKRVHVDDYVPGKAPEYYTDNWYTDLYLRIREVDEEGTPGPWHTVQLDAFSFAKNTSSPAALERLGFDDYDSVTWLEGLESDKDYQVQLWFDVDDNGRLDSQGRFVRETISTYHQDGTVTEEPGDWYHWQEPDVYSGIHNLNTDIDAFNIDTNADGVMDYFIS